MKSKKLKILVTEPESCHPDYLKILKKIGKVVSRKMSRSILLREIHKYDVLVVGVETLVDRKLLERAKNLKIVASNTTGTDHIDLEFAEKKGIKVLTLKDNPSILKKVTATAEHTFAIMLSLIRKIPWAFDSVRQRKWERYKFFGNQLSGKTIGIIGFGRLGKMVAKYAKAFDMNVIVYDPYASKDRNFKFTDLDTLLMESDIITLHVKLTKETENLISYREFKMMKRKPIIINTSRGKIINQSALIYALRKKLIKGAAIDVISTELKKNPLSNNPLVTYAKKHRNLLITPHLGGATEESLKITGVYIGEQILRALKR